MSWRELKQIKKERETRRKYRAKAAKKNPKKKRPDSGASRNTKKLVKAVRKITRFKPSHGWWSEPTRELYPHGHTTRSVVPLSKSTGKGRKARKERAKFIRKQRKHFKKRIDHSVKVALKKRDQHSSTDRLDAWTRLRGPR